MTGATSAAQGTWKVAWSICGEVLHVRPVNDLTWHPLEHDCVCGPDVSPLRAQPSGDQVGWAVIHHALDGRETIPVQLS